MSDIHNTSLPHKRFALWLIIIILVPVLGAAMYLLVLWGSWDYQVDFWAQEQCLQSGGVYSSSQERCWYAGECEDSGGFWYPRERRCVYDESSIESPEGVI